MDKQFTTLTSSYHDNYLQYKLTGNASYQNSYTSAEQGIESILSNLQDQVNTQNRQITNFYQSDVDGKIKDIRSQIRSTQRNVLKDSDQTVSASMRNISPSSSYQVPTSYFISIGVLISAGVLLLVLR